MLSYTRPDTSELQQNFINSLIETIQFVNSTPRDNRGVWYYEDYHAYCMRNKIIFDENFKTGFANPIYWEKTGRYTFKLKDGEKPSEAIRSFISGFTIADCGNIIVAAQYAALLKVLGEKKFNLLFSSSSASLIISQNMHDEKSTISHFFDVSNNFTASSGEIGSRPVIAGDFCHLRGVVHYLTKHPAGSSSGYNVVCVGKNSDKEDLFLGFGPDTCIKPFTEREFQKIFIDAYNADCTIFDIELLDKRKDSHWSKLVLPDDAIFVKGFLSGSVVRPDFKKINQYVLTDQSIVATKFFEAQEIQAPSVSPSDINSNALLKERLMQYPADSGARLEMTRFYKNALLAEVVTFLDEEDVVVSPGSSNALSKEDVLGTLNKRLIQYPADSVARLERARFYEDKQEYKNALLDYEYVYERYPANKIASAGITSCKAKMKPVIAVGESRERSPSHFKLFQPGSESEVMQPLPSDEISRLKSCS
jgi:protein-glutamine gamma-glutamyltransferase-like protein